MIATAVTFTLPAQRSASRCGSAALCFERRWGASWLASSCTLLLVASLHLWRVTRAAALAGSVRLLEA